MMLLLPFLLAVAYGDRCAGANGILGPSADYDVCCHAECPDCGGNNCWKKGNSGFYQGPLEGNKVGSNCCVGKIYEFFGQCSESVAAPCVLAKDQSAPQVLPDKCDAFGGMLGVTGGDADACCPKACGQCGGAECHRRRGAGANCCSGTVVGNNDFCSETNPAPCKIAKEPACAGVEMDDGSCCASGVVDACGVCDGGNDCHVGTWVDDQKCPMGHISGGTLFQGDGLYSTLEAARAACKAGCDARSDCKFADLYYAGSSATCYLKGDSCGDYMSNGHWAYQVYIKDPDAVAPPDCAGVPGGDAVEDDCGVCNGGNAAKDDCGVCNGGNASCADCNGEANGPGVMNDGACCASGVVDDCGVCDGSGATCGPIDTMDKLKAWCSLEVGNCRICKGKDQDDASCKVKDKKVVKCKNFKKNDVCDRITGCKTVTKVKKNKTKVSCRGKAFA